jgi:hypothetical protein
MKGFFYGFALIFTICLTFAGRAAAQNVHYGDVSNCSFLGLAALDNGSVTRLQCKFMPVSASRNLHIEYISGNCISKPFRSFAVKEFQIVTMPNGATRVPYQLPVQKNGVFVNGSYTYTATQTSLFANAGTPVYALLDLQFPVAEQTLESNVEQCTVSLSGFLTLE